MLRLAAACLGASILCTGCILTKEDLDCWYDDMCMTISSGPSVVQAPGGPARVAPSPQGARSSAALPR